jgi:polyisoprenoid-binding protein YceI
MSKKRLKCTVIYSIFLLCFFCNFSAEAQSYQPVDSLSSIQFGIKNFGLNTSGTFSGIDGKIMFNEKDIKATVFSISINAASVNTKLSARDNHLRKEEYLNCNKYPTIQFVSTEILSTNQLGEWKVRGNLNIKGSVKEVFILFHFMKNTDTIVFTGTTQINRRDFKVGSSSMVLSDFVNISLHVIARKLG